MLVLMLPDQCGSSLLNSHVLIRMPIILGGQKLDPVLYTQFSKCWVGVDNHFPRSPASAALNTAHNVIGFNWLVVSLTSAKAFSTSQAIPWYVITSGPSFQSAGLCICPCSISYGAYWPLLPEVMVTSHHSRLAQEYGERDNPKSDLSNKPNMQANKCFKLRSELHSVELTEFLILRSHRSCKYKIKENISQKSLPYKFHFPMHTLLFSSFAIKKKKKRLKQHLEGFTSS